MYVVLVNHELYALCPAGVYHARQIKTSNISMWCRGFSSIEFEAVSFFFCFFTLHAWGSSNSLTAEGIKNIVIQNADALQFDIGACCYSVHDTKKNGGNSQEEKWRMKNLLCKLAGLDLFSKSHPSCFLVSVPSNSFFRCLGRAPPKRSSQNLLFFLLSFPFYFYYGQKKKWRWNSTQVTANFAYNVFTGAN